MSSRFEDLLAANKALAELLIAKVMEANPPEPEFAAWAAALRAGDAKEAESALLDLQLAMETPVEMALCPRCKKDFPRSAYGAAIWKMSGNLCCPTCDKKLSEKELASIRKNV